MPKRGHEAFPGTGSVLWFVLCFEKLCRTPEHRQEGPKVAWCLAEQANPDKAANYSKLAQSLQREMIKPL